MFDAVDGGGMDDFRFPVAVVMQCEALANRWATEQWQVKGIVPDLADAGRSRRIIVEGGAYREVLFSGFDLQLTRDESYGYYLNVTAEQPKVFVRWRMQENEAIPDRVTLSYSEAARWLDSDEKVDAVAILPELQAWLSGFVAANYKPEPLEKGKRRRERQRG